jgi:hypothetical protein
MSSLSFKKLYKLIESNQFYNCHFFSIDGSCVYIKLISKIDNNSYMLYIPSKYDVKMANYKSYSLKEITNINSTKDIVQEYGYDKDNKNREDSYHDHGTHKDVNEFNLMDNYKSEININNTRSRDNEEVKCLYRQMKRLKYSVENLDYKLVIMYKSYLCVIARDNKITCYYIKNFNNEENIKTILVCADLEILFNKNIRIHNELIQVKSGIEKIINKNYVTNTKYIMELVKKNINISNIHAVIISKKTKLDTLYGQIDKLLQETKAKEKETRETTNNQEYLEKILKTKAKLIIKLNQVISKRDNLMLLYDKIFFDNIIMLDKITKNINLLNEI